MQLISLACYVVIEVDGQKFFQGKNFPTYGSFIDCLFFSVTLTSKNGSTPFKGFLIQAVSFYDGSKVYGKFVDLSNYTQYLNCTEVDSVPYGVRSQYRIVRLCLFLSVLQFYSYCLSKTYLVCSIVIQIWQVPVK